MANRKLVALAIISMMLISSFTFLVSMIPRSENTISEKASTYATSYTNSDIASLWIRKNGTDPYPFDFYGGANVSPSYGMNYFSTNVIQVGWDYDFTEISNLALFPLEADIYIQSEYTASYYTAIADFALTDYIANGRQRIRGAFIDDFQVGLQSPTNMSSFYTALHHEDASLAYDLTLGLIVYNRNYMNQHYSIPYYPYNWTDIASYFDIIHFWYYPFSYELLYNELAGYEDDFSEMYSILPTKEYWMGVYLHYYNLGSYDLEFTSEQLAIAGKLIKLGYATRYSLLENFWIQHNRDTAELIRDFINNQYQMDYSSTWFWAGTTVLSYSKGQAIWQKLIYDISSPSLEFTDSESYTFRSSALQNLTVAGNPVTTLILYNMRTGNWQYPFYIDSFNDTISYLLEPNEKYRIMDRPLTNLFYSTNTTLTGTINWYNKYVVISAMLTVNGSSTFLDIQDSIIVFNNPNTNNSMYYKTSPWYGLIIGTAKGLTVRILDTIIEPRLRAYPYYFNRPYSPFDTDSWFYMAHSVLAGYSYRFRPAGNVVIVNSTFFQVQPQYDNYPCSIWLETPSYVYFLNFDDNLIWNYPSTYYGTVGVFLMPSDLFGKYANKTIFGIVRISIKYFMFDRNEIVGGTWGLWIDMHYSGNELYIYDLDSYSPVPSNELFTEFRIDGDENDLIMIMTYTIYDWSIKSSIPGVSFVMRYLHIRTGIYLLTINDWSSNIAIDSDVFDINFPGPWRVYRDNFSLTIIGGSIDTSQTIDNLLMLFIIFLVPMLMTQFVPKIGFIFGMSLMLLIVAFEDSSFIPYMIFGFISIGILAYKSR